MVRSETPAGTDARARHPDDAKLRFAADEDASEPDSPVEHAQSVAITEMASTVGTRPIIEPPLGPLFPHLETDDTTLPGALEQEKAVSPEDAAVDDRRSAPCLVRRVGGP